MILRLTCSMVISSIIVVSGFKARFKRDFMYVVDANGTDTDCFQQCNDKHRRSFEYAFNMSLSDFYDFPLHPLVLSHSSYLLYCKLADQRTSCYRDKCQDYSADTVFSPSNFMCNFKRSHFTEVRPCLSEAEPITFLKCDQQCHDMVAKKRRKGENSDINQVYSSTSLDNYEEELSLLCSFQECYLECMQPVVLEVCSSSLGQRTVGLVKDLVQWHAADIADWHSVTGRDGSLPVSCRRLDGRDTNDPVLQIISKA